MLAASGAPVIPADLRPPRSQRLAARRGGARWPPSPASGPSLVAAGSARPPTSAWFAGAAGDVIVDEARARKRWYAPATPRGRVGGRGLQRGRRDAPRVRLPHRDRGRRRRGARAASTSPPTRSATGCGPSRTAIAGRSTARPPTSRPTRPALPGRAARRSSRRRWSRSTASTTRPVAAPPIRGCRPAPPRPSATTSTRTPTSTSPMACQPATSAPAATGPGVFDRVYDVTREPLASAEQQAAAITQLFYTINWLHDDWYDAGFTEAAGNGQTSTTAAAASRATRCSPKIRTTPTAARATTPTCRRPTTACRRDHAGLPVDRRRRSPA
jgi:hypothetical protein